MYSTSSGDRGPPIVLLLDSAPRPSCAIAVVLAVKLLDGPALYRAAIFGDSTGLLQTTKIPNGKSSKKIYWYNILQA